MILKAMKTQERRRAVLKKSIIIIRVQLVGLREGILMKTVLVEKSGIQDRELIVRAKIDKTMNTTKNMINTSLSLASSRQENKS